LDGCLEETEKVYNKTIDILRILVIKISSFGDLVLSIPSLYEIRNKFPKAKIKLLTSKKLQSFIYDCPYIDEIITLDDKYKKFKNIFKAAENLQRQSFDYIIDLQNNRFSHIISFLSMPRYSFGYSLRWGFLLGKRVKYNRNLSPLDSQERVLQLLGIKFKDKKLIFWERTTSPPMSLPDSEFIGINLSASKRWQTKNWPLKNIIRLIELINKNLPSFRVVLIGDEYSQNYAVEIEKLRISSLINTCGKVALRDLPQLLRKLSVFITPDTATLHLASALDIPTIAFFGPTDPERHIVKSKNIHVFFEKISCSFCYSPKCKHKEKNVCLENITPQKVLIQIKEIVKK